MSFFMLFSPIITPRYFSTCYPIEFWKKILPQKSELPNLVFFCFSLWTEQQTPTPHRPLAVLLNSSLLLSPQFSFFPQYSFSLQFSSHIDLFFIPRAQITLFPQLAVQGLHLPELGWGGPAHQDGHQRGHRPGGRKKIKRGKTKTKRAKLPRN